MNAVKDIPRLSVSKLISIFRKKEGDAYVPGCLITTRNSEDAADSRLSLSHPFSLNAFVLIFCKEGKFTITTNSKKFHIEPRDLYINFPGQIMHASSREDGCRTHIAVIDLDFIRDMNIDIKPIANKLIDIKNSQKLPISQTSFDEIINVIEAISDEINNNPTDDASSDILRGLISVMFFKICRTVDQNVKEKQTNPEVFDKMAGYFKEFMIHLGEHYKEERTVGFYADKMHLSPKYFTTLIKKASGQTAAEWINHYVILEAKNLLKYSTMNVQEIAYSLNFPNQSFFGKYFKHHTGMTPSEYKKSK